MARRSPNKYPSRYVERNRDIQLIHIGAEQLGMDTRDESPDSEYRSMLFSLTRKRSAAALDFAERKQVLDHLKACGFKVRHATGKAQPSRALANDPESKKVRALWLMLHELGAVKNPSESALNAYVKRMTGIDDLHWIDGHQAEAVIESLKKWAMRFLPARVEALAKQCAEAIQSGALQLDDGEIIALQMKIGTAQMRGTFDPMQWAYEALTHTLKAVAR